MLKCWMIYAILSLQADYVRNVKNLKNLISRGRNRNRKVSFTGTSGKSRSGRALRFSEGAKREIAQNTTSYLCLAPLTGERKSVREMQNCLVLLKLLCEFNEPIVCEADRHSSECTLAQQTLIVPVEGSKAGWMNGCFSVHKWPLWTFI